MRHNRKVIKMNPGYLDDGYGMFLIHRKNNPNINPDHENTIIKDKTKTKLALMRAKKTDETSYENNLSYKGLIISGDFHVIR